MNYELGRGEQGEQIKIISCLGVSCLGVSCILTTDYLPIAKLSPPLLERIIEEGSPETTKQSRSEANALIIEPKISEIFASL
jgi:hypothetical protein